MRFQLGQWIAGPFGLDFRLGLVGLRVLEAMAFEARNLEAQQSRRAMAPDMLNRLVDEPGCFDRVGSVTVEDRETREARQIGSDVLARRLIFRWNRDAVAIVLNIDEQRQLLRRGNS